VGTLDEPDRFPPDIHIYTQSRQPWFSIPPDSVQVPEFYDVKKQWPARSLERLMAARAKAATGK
jgi:hypothetical protein